MKNRFLETGLRGFEKHNMLELLLYYSIPRKDTNEIAHELLDTFGSLSGVFDAPIEELMKVKNISQNSAVLIKLIPALGAAYMDDRNSVGIVLNSAERIGAFLVPKFIGKTREQLYLLCLDNKNKLLSCTLIGEGEINKVPMQARKIAEHAFKVSAASVVLAHNHPQGFALPSDQDIFATSAVRKILKPLDIVLLDHIIVAGDDFVSLAQSGLFEGFE
ncbi:MAG: DNA repair protein RadC [Oscillospiraceae bacterium]|nr:DNA repair protein RadC [Oscillospiraceae bacterium]